MRTLRVVITDVAPDSPADDAGLQTGDVIREVNKKSVRDLQDYRKAMAQAGENKIAHWLSYIFIWHYTGVWRNKKARS